MQNKFEVTNLINPILKIFENINDEWSYHFKMGIREYLKTQTEKFVFTYTFLHRFEKVGFYRIYFPVRIKLNDYETDFSNFTTVLDKFKYITIFGIAGSGKSTLIQYIFLSSLKKKHKIPILIELRNINSKKSSLELFIYNIISNNRINPNDKILKRSLKSGKYLFLLDGYDELSLSRRQSINQELSAFIDAFPKNNYIVTSRPEAGIESFPRFSQFKVQNLSNKDINLFIDKMIEDKEKSRRIKKTISSDKNSDYKSFLSNPLLLSMFILMFESHPEIPKSKVAFYRNVFDTLCSKHDGLRKNSFQEKK